MQIGLNAISLYPGAIGGMETYFRNLLHWLQRIDIDNNYTVIYNEPYVADLQLFSDKFRVKTFNYEKNSFNWAVRGLLRNLIRVDPLRRQIMQLGLEVIHHPFNVLNPIGLATPSVLTINDIQHEYHPEFFSAVDLQKRRMKFRLSVAEARRIITISDYTRRCVMERYDVDGSNIDVIHIGCGEEYRPIEDDDAKARFREKYGLARPFLYYPAATWPHKNHKTLLAALKLLRERRQFDGELVLTGIAKQRHVEILGEIDRLGLTGQVKVLGYLPTNELPYLYNLAAMLVFPSLFEGFGIPVVEAMACGCPVACSNVTALPEVAGDAGVTFDPLSAEDMAATIWRVLSDTEEQQRLRAAGLDRTELFGWENIARRTLAVYQKAIAS